MSGHISLSLSRIIVRFKHTLNAQWQIFIVSHTHTKKVASYYANTHTVLFKELSIPNPSDVACMTALT